VAIKVPPRRLLALPIDETLTSMAWPGWAKGGSCAVIITEATLRSCMLVPAGTVTPICCSRAFRLCVVKGVCVVWSPGAIEPHDQAVAHQLVVAHALHRGHFLDAHAGQRHSRCGPPQRRAGQQ
jgi:hypothetical protein